MAVAEAALAYHEPNIVTILILSSFLILANMLNWALDRIIFGGLLGQIAIGIAWGTPGANWLPDDVQSTIMQLGYLGLILLVMEGGLSTDLKSLKSNLPLSCLVALIGVATPVGLSFVLMGLVEGTTAVQAFAAGAALCSTSLGTTFTILSTSGLSASRLGVVLSSAAMLDDIIGLVMSGVISRLGQSSGNFGASTVVRPVFVSIAFAVVIPLTCMFIVKPVTKFCHQKLHNHRSSQLYRAVNTEHAALILQTLLLAALVTAASYAGTSVLFAAYLTGAAVSWWDGLCKDIRLEDIKQVGEKDASKRTNINGQEDANSAQVSDRNQTTAAAGGTAQESSSPSEEVAARFHHLSGVHMFEKYYSPALRTILKPLFFASIGFAIPISRMFSGAVLWRGIVYTLLMILAKLICGICLIRFEAPVTPTSRVFTRAMSLRFFGHAFWPIRTMPNEPHEPAREDSQVVATSGSSSQTQTRQGSVMSKMPKPMSLYPAAMLGSAMVARGEIGFLISSVAESNGIFGTPTEGGSAELYLIVTWAILVCTLIGPVAVGSMAKRVKRLQDSERSSSAGKTDPLGIWGIQGKMTGDGD